MRGIVQAKRVVFVSAAACLLLLRTPMACAQDAGSMGKSDAPQAAPADLAAVGSLLRQLQAQVQDLSAQVKDLKTQQDSTKAESLELRKELEQAKTQFVASAGSANGAAPTPVSPATSGGQGMLEDRIAKIEEDQQLADSKIAEQSQTKVESGSKYRVRLSGMVLLNAYGIRGNVENADFPQLALPNSLLGSNGSLGASLRQSQIGLEAFGPTIAGARTSADIQFDLAGGVSESPNGVSFGIMRLRTGTVRFDWTDTSLIVGQDSLFLAPMSPTSIATLATPALAYSGNLWSWTPQIRVEHKFTWSDSSRLLVQGGLLDNLTGDVPGSEYYRNPSWGEYSGQPAYAARFAWTQRIGEQEVTFGAGAYYSRQLWGYGRSVDGWAGTLDLKLPLGNKLEFTSQFYRGRAIGGIGGGIGQTTLWVGSLADPTTDLYGLDAVGGWAQLKYKATSKLQFNAAFGLDNPFAYDLREFGGEPNIYGQLFSKNQTALVNFIYQPRSDFVFSLEYRRLKTFILDSGSNSANVTNFSIGYIF